MLFSTASFGFSGNSRRLENGPSPFWYGRLILFYWLLITGPVASAQTLTWQKQYNGPHSLNEAGIKVKSDASGNVYVTGSSEGDIVTLKYNASGVQQWVARYDSAFFNSEDQANQHSGDQPTDLLVDAAGNVYVTGTSHFNYNCDKTVVTTLKYNSAGVRQWIVQNTAESFCASTGPIVEPRLEQDGEGNLYLSTMDYGPAVLPQQVILQKLSPAGQQVWKSSFRVFSARIFDLAVDATGNSYITGNDTTAFLLKYNNGGALQWRKNIGQPAISVKSDASGNVYVTGSSEGDIVTLKYNAAGAQQWRVRYDSVFFNSEDQANQHTGDEAADLAVDASGNAYVTGTSHYDFNCDKTVVTTLKYNSAGVRQWKVENTATLSCANTGQIEAPHLRLDGAGNLYISVSYSSANPSDNPIVLQKLSPAGHQFWKSTYQSTHLVQALALHVDGPGNAYITGRIEENNGNILTLKYAASATPACTASGTILREYWANVPGSSIASIPVNTPPTSTSQLTILRTAANVADNYAQRIRGYICAPATGNFTFFIQGDDNAELYLSTDNNPTNKQRIASAKVAWSWTVNASQQSAPISLIAGKSYYLEVLHKEASGGDQVRVGWRTPSMAANAEPLIIPGSVLSPFVNSIPACSASGSILREYWANVPGSSIASIPVNTPPTSSSQLTILRTAANVADNYAQRIRGYICAPATGNFTFFIQGDDNAELWLSTDNNPTNKHRIASASLAWSWTVNASQQSAPISLVAGKSYYVEVLHKEASGGDQVRVGWRTPSMAANAEPLIIPGSVLSPFVAPGAREAVSEPNTPEVLNNELTAAPNPFSERTTIAFTTAATEQARLQVYDLQGRLVGQLYDGLSQAGEVHQLGFDGNGLGQGLYLVRLATAHQISHQKLLLTR